MPKADTKPVDAGWGTPVEVDYKARIGALVAELIGIAADVLAKPEAPPPEGTPSETVHVNNAGRIMVEAGRDDLLESLDSLLYEISRLDERARPSAYASLLRLLHGVRNVAGYGITPAASVVAFGEEAVHEYQEKAAAGARSGRAKKLRDDPREPVIAEELAKHPEMSIRDVLVEVNQALKRHNLRAVSKNKVALRRKKLMH